jgi:hypothetical protein
VSWSLTESLLRFPGDGAGTGALLDERLARQIADLELALSNRRIQVLDYERRIAMLIRPGQIHYSCHLQRLYFVEGRGQPLHAPLRGVVEGLGLRFEPSPISSDEHGIFTNGYMLPLPESGRETVAVALRLLGAALY